MSHLNFHARIENKLCIRLTNTLKLINGMSYLEYCYCTGQNISEVYSHCGNKTNMKTHSNEQVLKALSKKSSLKKAFGRRVMTKKKGK